MELDSLDNLNREYVWRILWSHVRSGDATIKYFTDILSESLGKENNEDVIIFLLGRLSYCLSMGFFYGDQMRRILDP